MSDMIYAPCEHGQFGPHTRVHRNDTSPCSGRPLGTLAEIEQALHAASAIDETIKRGWKYAYLNVAWFYYFINQTQLGLELRKAEAYDKAPSERWCLTHDTLALSPVCVGKQCKKTWVRVVVEVEGG